VRVAIYTRISTDEDRQPFSLGAQAERLEAYARSQDGWRIVRRFTDQASGATLDRPGLRRALSEAAAGVYELLLVCRVDRLSRSVRQLAEIGENLEDFGVSLRSATEPFDTSTAGKMMLQMLAVFAEFERTTIVERITAGMERAASEGRWIVGSTPFGYIRDRGNKQIVPDPARVEIVRRIFGMYAADRMGAETIAQVLNAEGHRSKNGVPFARPNVLWILRNPVYVGRVAFRGKLHPGRHEAIIDEQTFETVQAILAERGGSQALKRAHPSDYLLSGVLRCGRCRKAYVGTAAHGRKNRYRYYICSTRYRYGTNVCDGIGCRWKRSRMPSLSRWRRSSATRPSSTKPSPFPKLRRLELPRSLPDGSPRSSNSSLVPGGRSIGTSARSSRGSCRPRTARNASSACATGSRRWRPRSERSPRNVLTGCR
jgi:site-specific DNA recombinase